MNEEQEFKVVDKRHSAGATDKEVPSESKSGEGFTMKEPPDPQPQAPLQIDLSTFILSLATSAFIHIGLAPDPATQKIEKNLELARQNIELLSLLKTKTKGNLTEDENGLLENLLTEVRLRFVEASKK
jgi:hypothetical protein